jgi:hypothetical protein
MGMACDLLGIAPSQMIVILTSRRLEVKGQVMHTDVSTLQVRCRSVSPALRFAVCRTVVASAKGRLRLSLSLTHSLTHSLSLSSFIR